nr:reverse transcriptase domain-containing protein [Tanacetum cinerariifolium]
MKLNPKKCTFGIKEGMFPGYKVNTKGIKVCSDKVKAVLSLQSPKCLKDVQNLNGKLASLNRFLSKLAEKSLPFFKALKKCTKKRDFQWTTKAEAAFKQMKQLIAKLPTLTTPMEKQELIVYLAAAKEVVSAVLMIEREAKRTHGSRGGTSESWILFTDRSSCVESFRVGLILINSKGEEFTYALRFRFDATNNEAKYEALIAGLRIANQMGIKTFNKGHKNMILLADNACGCKKNDKGMSGLPGSSPRAKEPTSKADSHRVPKAILQWIKAKPVATITGNRIKKFVWDNIVCRFGLSGEIISNNGKQFRDNPFKDWCEKLCIRQRFASAKHPQANGLVERENKSLGEGIKAWLDERSKDWIEEIPLVLWAHRTMIKSSNGDTPFLLTYGRKAVIPTEIGMPTLRTTEIDMVRNDEALEINIDLFEERREQAAIREA